MTRRVVGVAGAGLLASLTLAAAAADLGSMVSPYLAARDRAAVGSVAGRAYEEPRRTGAEPKPYSAVSVLLLPRSPSFERELAVIKAGRGDSPEHFVDADAKIRAARISFEQALIEAGAGALMKGDLTGEGGTFRFLEVPEGPWVLLAWQESASRQRLPTLNKSDAARYPNRSEVLGSYDVTYWFLPVDVRAGEETPVRLHDRNTWLTGVRENRGVRNPEKRTAPGKQQGASPR